ncbi:MAG: thioredoxin domain-containing protein [Chitinophagaceae bacterium]|jgi:hypothetical protein|nr:thioredoxin domain-containing protein [Chitinophagaceae bacterium]
MHTNKLIHESSPYLLQHAHNPVNWFPWGEEALTKAKAENKPILVSIGYAACHWCHVMERESFENEETAAIMNEHFINIKIDREERPDLDHIYMDAVQAITGSGGWPLNVFLTPDCKPFFGGTYFPPVKAYNRNSWTEVLLNIAKAFTERNSEIEEQANKLTNHLVNSNLFGQVNSSKQAHLFSAETAQIIADNILKQADTTWGGFGNAPKFPQTFSIQYLLRHYHFTKHEPSLQQALLSLDKMIAGGIYDQIGGGFARYSTDAQWLAPHFEKMLYDNALLVGVLSEAYQLTKNTAYATIIHQTLGFIEREMTHELGGFFSALDADSEGVEGKFYTWSLKEIETILGDNAQLYSKFYDITEEGNWEHTNILWVTKSYQEFALENSLTEEELTIFLEQCNNQLLSERNKRIRPALDDKILLGWNSLMITAYCKAYSATANEKYKQIAIATIAFLEEKFIQLDGSWYHTYKNNQAKIPAFLDDYAYTIQAYIHLQEITGNQVYLEKAATLTSYVIEHFSDEGGLFYYTHQNQNDIIVRKKEVYDGATPSGNAVMTQNLVYLSIVYNNLTWANRAENNCILMANALVKYPTSFGVWAAILQQKIVGTKEIVITGHYFTQSLSFINQLFVPNKVLQSTDIAKNNFPLLANKLIKAENTFYLCQNYNCLQPTNNLEAFLAIM